MQNMVLLTIIVFDIVAYILLLLGLVTIELSHHLIILI